MRRLRILTALIAFFVAWNIAGLLTSPLGAFTPNEAGFAIGSTRAQALQLALAKTDGVCAEQLGDKVAELASLGYTSNYCPPDGSFWVLEYRDWSVVGYPRYQFITLRFEGDRVVQAEGRRIFWIVV